MQSYIFLYCSLTEVIANFCLIFVIYCKCMNQTLNSNLKSIIFSFVYWFVLGFCFVWTQKRCYFNFIKKIQFCCYVNGVDSFFVIFTLQSIKLGIIISFCLTISFYQYSRLFSFVTDSKIHSNKWVVCSKPIK